MTARDSLRSTVKAIFPALMSIGVLVFAASVSATEISVNTEFNKAGHILIADQFNNRVIEDPAGNIVWSFGLGPMIFRPIHHRCQRRPAGRPIHADGRHRHTGGRDSPGP